MNDVRISRSQKTEILSPTGKPIKIQWFKCCTLLSISLPRVEMN
jgi:hypothetical protein